MTRRNPAFRRLVLLAGAVPALVLHAAVPAPPAARAGEKYALVVGVNDYLPTELPSLQYAEADAEALAQAFEGLGFSVVAMTSRSGVAFRPTTAERIVEQAARRLEDRDASDTVVVALSGHGLQFKGDREFYFCPGEARLADRSTLVPMSRLLADIGRCKAGRKLLLVDACRDELTPESAGKGVEVVELEPAGVFRADPPAGTVAVFSCRAREKSYELKQLGHSVFTHHVVEYLSGRAPPDRYPSQGDVSVSELAAFVRSRTRDLVDTTLAKRQTPDVVLPDGTFAEWPLGRLGDGRRPAPGDLASLDRPLPAVPRPAAPRPGETVANSLGMKLVTIPAGTFSMGSAESREQLESVGFRFKDDDTFDSSDEAPVHEVRITKPFRMGVHEVTLGEFLKFYHDGYQGRLDCETDDKGGWGYDGTNSDKPFFRKPKYRPWSWGHPGMDTSTDAGKRQAFRHPVVNVSWNDAVAFCGWLSRKEGKKYRLPTEAEWEYACRAGTTTRFWNGNDPEGLATIGNVMDGTVTERFSGWKGASASRDGYVFTAPVGSFHANPFGLHDMHGNVAEWCSDWYDEKYYSTSPTADPKGPGSAGSFRVFRGGSWGSVPNSCRSARRRNYAPTHCDGWIGFRVVCELE